jgi:D-xylose transport system permease protein
MTSANPDPAEETATGTAGGTTTATAAPDDDALVAASTASASADLLANSMGDYLKIMGRRVRSGESGALPVVVGLIAIVIFFQVDTQGLFLEPRNLVNLMEQSAFVIILGMAEIFVLLLGDIDLAAGFTAACGAVVALWMLALGDSWWLSLIVALAASAAYGALQGYLISKLKLASFVVTLAGQLGLSGVLIWLIGQTGSIGNGGVISLHSSIINDIEGGQLTATATWIVMLAIVIAAGAIMLYGDIRRRNAGLVAPPLSVTLLKVGLLIVAGVIVALIANANRSNGVLPIQGLPWVVLVVLGVLFIWSVLLGRTRFGRYMYAIGGNAEAARRAGVSIVRIRTIAFTLCGLTAGLAGIIYASQLGSISSNVNGGQNVLNAVAAAVIGGTSLFGGRGKMLHALIGGLVVGVINNGLELLGMSSDYQLMWTALVLLAAILVDRLTRRGQTAT